MRGSAATLPAVSSQLESAEIFHFCGHGVSNSDDGLLMLAPYVPNEEGSLLTAASLSDLKMNRCKLVVLSACSTGAGESRGPANPASLVNGFLRAGVRDVVASRWRVDSASTAALMREFYGRVTHTGEIAPALQFAEERIRSRSGMGHPYYWSGFSVFGE